MHGAASPARQRVVFGSGVLARGHGRAEGGRARAGRRRGRRAVPGRAGAAPYLARRVCTTAPRTQYFSNSPSIY